MINIAVIPAKGNSTRIPRKNIRDFLGKPIIAYSIETAKLSKLFDKIIVSTNSEDVARIARSYDAYVLWRPDYLCDEPDCGTQEVTRHAIDFVNTNSRDNQVHLACCIYPTAPLMTYRDLLQAKIALMRVPTPAFAYAVGPDGKDAGAFYFGHAKAFFDREPLGVDSAHVIIPDERVCDVNIEEDWGRCEAMYIALQEAEIKQRAADGV